MKRLCTALALALLAGCTPAFAQGLNVRSFDRTVDPRNVTTTDKLTWYAGESIEYIVRSRRGREVVDVPVGSVPVWVVMQGTNVYLIEEGEVVTNGTVRFWAPAAITALPAGSYTSWASAYQGTNRVGVIDRTSVEVRWRPGDAYTATAPLENVLDDIVSWWADANANLAAVSNALSAAIAEAVAAEAADRQDADGALSAAIAQAESNRATAVQAILDDLENYLTASTAAITYQPLGSYQPAGDYATTAALAEAIATLATTGYVAAAIAEIPAPDLTPYATSQDLATAVAPLASTSYVDQAIAEIDFPAPDLTPYATTGALAEAIAPLATTGYVAAAIAEIPAPDLTPYATSQDLATAVAPLASTSYVDQAIAEIDFPAPDLTPYATTGALAEAIAPLATTGYVAAAIAEIEIPDPDLSAYATTQALATAVAPLASTSYVDQAIAEIDFPAPDLTPYATTGALAEAIAPLATTGYVAAAIAEIPAPDLTPYATSQDLATAVAPLASTSYVDQAIAEIDFPAPDLTPYATTGALAEAIAPLATTGYVAAAIAEIEIPDPDLSAYATTQALATAVAPLASTSYVDQAIAEIDFPAPDLTPYATTGALAEAIAPLATTGYVAAAIAEIEIQDPDLSAYATTQALAAVEAAIPSIDGLATTSYVASAIGALPPIPGINDIVPPSRTISINGVAYNLSADRSWTIDPSGGAVYGGVYATELISPTDAYTNIPGLPVTITTNTLHISGLESGSMRIAIVTTNEYETPDTGLAVSDGTTVLANFMPSCDGAAQVYDWTFTGAPEIYISALSGLIPPSSTNALPPIITAIQIYAPADPSLIGKVSDFAGQIHLHDDPEQPRQVVNLRSAESLADAALKAANSETHSRSADTTLNEWSLYFGPRFSLREEGENLNLYYGETLIQSWVGGGVVIPRITAIAHDGSNVFLTVLARTNSTLDVLWTTNASDWSRIESAYITQTIAGEKSVMLQFENPAPSASSGFFAVESVVPPTTIPLSRSIATPKKDDEDLATQSWVESYVATNSSGGGVPATNVFAGLPSILVSEDWTWTNQIYAVGADTSATNINITLPDGGTNFTSVVVRKFSNLHQLRILRGTNVVYTLYDDGATRSYDWWPQRTNWYWRQ